MKKILVPIDGSENSVKALLEAKKLASVFHSDISILNVVDTSKYFMADYNVAMVSENVEHSKKLLKSSLDNFKDCECNVDIIHKVGDASNEIIKLAAEGNYDLVVMGSRGLGTFSRAFLGSVSNKVLNHIDKTVLIVK